jgi:hypothetical protein
MKGRKTLGDRSIEKGSILCSGLSCTAEDAERQEVETVKMLE